MLVNLYFPCYYSSNVKTTDKYIDCIEYVEFMLVHPIVKLLNVVVISISYCER